MASNIPMSSDQSGLLQRSRGSFSRQIAMVLSLVLAVALLGSTIGFWSFHRVSGETETMIKDLMSVERLAADLQRHILVNVARSKAFSLSSKPQVGDALSPEIQQTSVQIDDLLRQLAGTLRSPEDLQILARMTQANQSFTAARQELSAARDSGVTASINRVYQERFNPAADPASGRYRQPGGIA